ncbi:hypothetical protein GCM10007301_47950 [Azorhizobium oxalatiphilum]|uniref:Uncharacterized protein n=1 Tax=Azorhizobium oxalatiphilum TaxID=980631 RepID=A0A917CB28_9HYPH|nr:hypothetical protein [Azorhizobium oxalatiphilum]GGF82262.1 hypothetical protein GCM10007301_47950 [Azorhizobium oxalatiphilum]
MALLTCVRCQPLKHLGNGYGGLGAAEAHGKRLDEKARSRVVRDIPPIAWSAAGSDRGLDIVAAHRVHLDQTHAVLRKGAAVGMHLMAIISHEWLTELGESAHSSANERVLALVSQAWTWVETWCGENSCFALRYDCDEKGSGVVDLFVAPVQMQGRRGGRQVPTISIASAKKCLRSQFHDQTEYAALQSSWAAHANLILDPRFQRGAYKLATRREHVRADVFAALAEETKRAVIARAFADVTPSMRLIREAAERFSTGMDEEQMQRMLSTAVTLLRDQQLLSSSGIAAPHLRSDHRANLQDLAVLHEALCPRKREAGWSPR